MPWLKLDDGTHVHINTGHRPRKRCHFCNRFSDKLCDFPVGKGKTCDAAMCSKCATVVGENRDYCPRHKHQTPAQASLALEGVA